MKWVLVGAAALGLGGVFAAATVEQTGVGSAPTAGAIERGKYLVKIGGCNDCHTPGYLAKAGDIPEDRWLIGDSLGFNGPWGTTYPTNLRRLLGAMEEDDWVEFARTIETRPPMPWFNLRAMSEDDLRDMHAFVVSLPPNDGAVPDYVPPGQEPKTPHIVFVPRLPKA